MSLATTAGLEWSFWKLGWEPNLAVVSWRPLSVQGRNQENLNPGHSLLCFNSQSTRGIFNLESALKKRNKQTTTNSKDLVEILSIVIWSPRTRDLTISITGLCNLPGSIRKAAEGTAAEGPAAEGTAAEGTAAEGTVAAG